MAKIKTGSTFLDGKLIASEDYVNTNVGTKEDSLGTGTTSQYLRGDKVWDAPPDTTYSEITTTEIDAGTASTLRTITARRLKYAFETIKASVALVAESVAWANITGKPSTFEPSSHTHDPVDINTDATNRFVTDAEKTTWNAKAEINDIPTNVSELTNDSDYATKAYADSAGLIIP